MRRVSGGLSELEQLVMEHIWRERKVTAMATRDALQLAHPMRESTVRTIFRRLERKGFLRHEVAGRTFLYRAAQPRENAMLGALKGVLDRFCEGSAERLVLGLVASDALTPAQLERIRRQIAASARARTERSGK
ncbi:MAG TPA: BlaI/MecI/CopY family transcriptional regulator [Terriglobales bacterium]|nr:BlaI/MecI/CopY family transcriptional regulator [Terriglobales bacterium]